MCINLRALFDVVDTSEISLTCQLYYKKNNYLASPSPSRLKALETRLQIVMPIRDAQAILQIYSKLVIFLQYQFTTLLAHLQEVTRAS